MQTPADTDRPPEWSNNATREAMHTLPLRATGRVIGVLFVLGTVAGVLSAIMLTPLLDAPDLLGAITDDPARARLGASLIVVMGFALALIPLLAFPVLRAQDEPLAVGYVVVRGGLETAIYLTSAVVWLVLISLGHDYAAADARSAVQLETLSAAVLELSDAMGDVALAIVFSLGALIFNRLLLRGRLVPRWLSGWGLLAASLWLSAGVLALFGLVDTRSTEQMAMALPIAVQEMVLAGWLIAKGFDTPSPGEERS